MADSLITIDKVNRTVTIHVDRIREVPEARGSMDAAVDWTMIQTREVVKIMTGQPSALRYVTEGL